MNRSNLDKLRALVRDFRASTHRCKLMEAELRKLRADRRDLADDLAHALAESAVPEGQGFEAYGLVVWYHETPRQLALNHVFLAHYHQRRD